MPRAKGMFELGTLGTLGWGATGSLGNLARAASISSLLIIAFVAALTCLGAISGFYITVSPLFQVGKLQEVSSKEAAVGVCRFAGCTNWWQGGSEGQLGESEEESHRFATPTFPPTLLTSHPCQVHPDLKALELP